ncbi:MAG TPA: purine-nucleoside phosphorylase [Bacteroidales bacterium]|nr:MAG: purine-nucleoside phosphorylase [Bacteroidetes bacterium GWF2_33_38]OFY75074.1 MAG: purine-nucleoside phosphorylase [Bacteroidetes bacterium RIFOXYA12_FULL_33_9]HBF88617.1 purine-nucleoside phosphorylase [Bacteroidales bacterium]
MIEKFKSTATFLKERIKNEPEIGIILGSGLGGLANKLEDAIAFEYKNIPNFPVSTVEGHSGKLVFGKLGGKNVVAMQGRFHFYEGYPMDVVTFPVRVMKFLGVKYLFVSNAAGGLNPDFKAGDMMIINDHINYFPTNPLIGKNYNELGPRFPDMSKTYNRELIAKAKEIAKQNNLKVQEGIYIGSSGPTLETPAEYRLFHKFGADATGMSTVPEVIVAHHMGIKCFGMSVITNGSEPADPNGETTHDEVQDVAGSVEPKMTLIFTELIKSL